MAEANELVSIASVLQMLGVQVPEDLGARSSHKVHCPFGEVYHSDHGASPAMRLYPDSNSAYCFSCTAYYTPVSLAAKGLDIDLKTAAIQLLDRIGHKPLDLAAHWQAVKDFVPEPDKALMADALKTFCRRIDARWAARQFEPKIAQTLTRCLGILDMVRTAEDVTTWLEGCKLAMRTVLHIAEPSVREKYEVLWDGLSGGPKEQS